MQSLKSEIQTGEVLQDLSEGLQPILKNLKPELLSEGDKKAILYKLEQLEQLALQIKRDILKK